MDHLQIYYPGERHEETVITPAQAEKGLSFKIGFRYNWDKDPRGQFSILDTVVLALKDIFSFEQIQIAH